MSSVVVMSWNVESLGEAKACKGGAVSTVKVRSKLFKFLQYSIEAAGADIVGLMELKGGAGALTLAWLLKKLNDHRPQGSQSSYVWNGRCSSKQDGGTMEEYLLLWKEEQGRVTLEKGAKPGPVWLMGVVDDNALESFYEQFPSWTAAQRATLKTALDEAGYTFQGSYMHKRELLKTVTKRVTPEEWQELDKEGAKAEVKLKSPPPGLGAVQCQELAQILLAIDILRFPTFAERSPFLARFSIGGKPVTLAMLHAPGPGDPKRTDAINIMALSPALAAPGPTLSNVPSLLLMGDFNISENYLFLQPPLYERVDGAPWFRPKNPKEVAKVFGPIEGDPVKAPSQLAPGAKTSLVHKFLPDNTTPDRVLANDYDKFFFRGAPGVGAKAPRVENLITALAEQQGKPSEMQMAAVKFFKAFRADLVEKEKNRLRPKIEELTAKIAAKEETLKGIKKLWLKLPPGMQKLKGNSLVKRGADAARTRDLLARRRDALQAECDALAELGVVLDRKQANLRPSGVGTAFAVYRYAVSDHLPIAIELTMQ